MVTRLTEQGLRMISVNNLIVDRPLLILNRSIELSYTYMSVSCEASFLVKYK